MCQRSLFTFSLDTRLASSHSGLSCNVKSTERPLGLQSTLPFVHLVKSLVHRLVYFLSLTACKFCEVKDQDRFLSNSAFTNSGVPGNEGRARYPTFAPAHPPHSYSLYFGAGKLTFIDFIHRFPWLLMSDQGLHWEVQAGEEGCLFSLLCSFPVSSKFVGQTLLPKPQLQSLALSWR